MFNKFLYLGMVYLPAIEKVEEDENIGSCIICVGSTGTGKSSTVAKYTGIFDFSHYYQREHLFFFKKKFIRVGLSCGYMS